MAQQPDNDALERLLTRTLHSASANDDACPSAEDVAAYLERSLAAEETRRIELHLSSCARCAETLALLVETEPVPSPAMPSSSWWSWSVWRWAVPAAAVVVIGVWFASTLPGGPEPASQIAQYDQTKERPKAEAAAPAREAGEPAAADVSAAEKSATDNAAVDELARTREALSSLPREQETRTVDSIGPLTGSAARPVSEADSAAPRASTPAQSSPESARAQAKAESRADAVPADRRNEDALAGFAAPAAPPTAAEAPAVSAGVTQPSTAPAAAPAAPAAPTAAAGPASETAKAAAALPATGAARAAGAGRGAGGRAASREAAPPSTLRQSDETQERAANVAGFAPLVLRTRSGSVTWRIAGSVVERSADGGTSWTPDYRASAAINSGVVSADDTVWLAGAAGLILQRSSTGTWRVVPPPVRDDLVGVSEPGPTSVTVRAAAGRQYRTTDNGATWMAR